MAQLNGLTEKAMAMVVIAMLAMLAMLHLASAGCYKDKSLKRDVPMDKRFLNFEPAPMNRKLPKEFNWCDVDGVSYCTPSWNQHLPVYCGACWVHGTLSALNDRIKILKGGQGIDVMLGRQTLLNCAAYKGHGNGCDGGDPIDVFWYMYEYGLPHEDCMPYSATDHTKWKADHLDQCPDVGKCLNCMPINDVDTCWPVETPILYRLKSFGQCCNMTDPKDNVQAMMSEIYHRGPITCGVAANENFVYKYRDGIWEDDGDRDIDHDVEIVGWGEEKGKKYWIARNSWGTYWGELGFFRIERGTNAQGIEMGDCWVGEPEISMEQKVKKHKLVGTMYGVIPANSSDKDTRARTDSGEAAGAAVAA